MKNNINNQDWYFLNTGSNDGFFNMACDECLLDLVVTNKLDKPILRVYSWNERTLSLGVNQDIDKQDLNNIVVKRVTGGQAVLHGDETEELTYSVVGYYDSGFKKLYYLIGEVLILFLKKCEVDGSFGHTDEKYVCHFDCFESKTEADIVANGIKVIGSAQTRKKKYILQHGSIKLSVIKELTGKTISFHEAIKLLTSAFQEKLNIKFLDFQLPDKLYGTIRQAKKMTIKPLKKKKYVLEEVEHIYNLPFLDLVYKAQEVHRKHQPLNKIQLCTLSNIKSGNCPEDCKYCPQSIKHDTGIEKYALLPKDEILEQVKVAKKNGATRFCMGAAWKNAPHNKDFENILDIIREVSKLNMEVCCTLGMLTKEQAFKLKKAGLTAYNHNLDTSEEFYKEIITTRTYKDRLKTIQHISDAGIQVCCGGIIGLGETQEDRIKLLYTLANLNPQPESVPINTLVRVKGTPLEKNEPVDSFELVRSIATARILLPEAKVRLSAGRLEMSQELQTLCFLAGANSIFTGEKLLTTDNPSFDNDKELFAKLKMEAM